jgi:hypothetical protein
MVRLKRSFVAVAVEAMLQGRIVIIRSWRLIGAAQNAK